MWKNDYQYKDYSQSFDVADGEHKIKIVSVKDVKSKTGKNMIEVHYNVQDSNGVEYVDRIVEGDFFDMNMSRVFDAFGIVPGNFTYMNWIGKVASAIFAHKDETYTDESGAERNVKKSVLVKYNVTKTFQQNNAPTQATSTMQPPTPEYNGPIW